MAPSERLAREIERLEPGSDRVSLSDVRIGFACKQRWDDMVGNRALDEPHDWSATIGLEVEPIGAIHALLDLVRGR